MPPRSPDPVASTHIAEPYRPPSGPVPLRHVGPHLLVADKPSGLLTVPGRGPAKADCLMARLLPAWPGLMAVHRLDMETSGLLVLARDADMHRALSAAFAERRVHKRYVAVVKGRPAADHGEVNAPLLVDWPNRPRQAVNPSEGKPSLTRWQWLSHDTASDTSRLLLEPVTGRTHQLRVHLAHIGHPILGDALYAPAAVRAAAPRLLLHAAELALPAVGAMTGPLVLNSEAPF